MNRIMELADAYAQQCSRSGAGALANEARAALAAEIEQVEAENAKLKHNIGVLTDALWKSCGDDEEAVNATIESQGELK